MIKILHTSDWHLGQMFYNYDRADEVTYFFDALTGIIRERRPDALLISGDIYDVGVPTLEARRQWTGILEALTDEFPDMDIIATAGNHDSGSSLDIGSQLLRKRIHLVGRSEKFIKICAADGSQALVAAVPFISEGRYRGLCGDEEAKNPMKAYYRNVLEQAHGLVPQDMQVPVILMAHLAVSAPGYNGHAERNFNFYDVDYIGDNYDYAALGHIHYPHAVGQKARYSGSPIPMSFDEEYAHSVTEVVFDVDSPEPKIEAIEIDPYRCVETYPKVDESPMEAGEVECFLRNHNYSERKYLRIRYKSGPEFGAEIRRRIEIAFAGKATRLCELQPVVESVSHDKKNKASSGIHAVDLHNVDPMQLVADFSRRIGQPLTEKQSELLKKILG